METKPLKRAGSMPNAWLLALTLWFLHADPALASTNQVWSWGGIVTELRNIPSNLTSTVSLVAGGRHTLALQADGTVVGWGDNAADQITIPEQAYTAVAIAAGRFHSLALLEDGTVITWGDDSFGVGQVPAGLTNVRAMDGGAYHSLALLQDGSLVAWGDNSYGQGDIPINAANVAGISSGRHHNLALLATGTVLAWGSDSDGQVSLMPAGLSNVVAVSAGGYHSLALKADGTVVGWGGNDYNQSTPPAGLSNVVAIAAGDDFNIALRADGTVVGWQQEIFGGVDVPAALTNPATANAVTVSAGLTHGVALASDQPIGFVYPRDSIVSPGATLRLRASMQWRRPLSYQWLHNGASIAGATNQTLELNGFQWEYVGQYHCVASDGVGATTVVGTTASMQEPSLIQAHPTESRVAAGDPATFSVSASCRGDLAYQWRKDGIPLKEGVDFSGVHSDVLTIPDAQGRHMGRFDVVVRCGFLGAISSAAPLVLQPVVAWGTNSLVPSGLTNIVALAADGDANLALDNRGRVLEWNGTDGKWVIHPVQRDRMIAVSSGAGHRLALRDDRTVVAWGDNRYGQASVPAGLSNIMAVAAGGYHSLALRPDGTVSAWGANWSGQVSVPAGLSNVISIAAGAYHSLALGQNGRVTAWGATNSGQGVVPANVSNVTAIAAGAFHNLALRTDGTVLSWGENSQKQIAVPPGLHGVVSIGAGPFHSLAVRADGTLVAWGNNEQGQSSIPSTLTNVLAAVGGGDRSVALIVNRPALMIHPFDPIVPGGATLKLETRVAWFGPVTYQWSHQTTNLPGATNATLILTNFQVAAAGEYRCVVQAANGMLAEANTTACLLNPSFLLQTPVSTRASLGATLQLAVSANCPGPLTYQWRREGLPLVEADPYSGTTSNVLTLAAVSSAAAGDYTAVVRCGWEAAISPVARVETGQTVEVAWNPSPGPEVAGYRVYSGERSREYSMISNVGLATNHIIQNLEDGTLYYIAVTAYDSKFNAGDFSDEIYYVTPGPPKVPLSPSILEQPVDQVIGVGSNALFRVVAQGAGTLLYQWHKDGAVLTNNGRFQGVGEPELHVQHAGGLEAGRYSVTVTNVISGAASSDARLHVHVPPTLLPPVTLSNGTTLLSIVNSDGSPITSFQAMRYWVQACTNLVEDKWAELALPMELVNGTLVMEDPESLLLPRRFFRSVQMDDPMSALRLQPPQPLPGGNMRLCLECSYDHRPLTPSEVSSLIVEATADPSSPTNWTVLPGPPGLIGDKMMLEDSEAAQHPHRFYRAQLPQSPSAAVRLRGEVGETNDMFRLVLSREDGLPLKSSDVFNHEVLGSDDALDPFGWSLLSGSMHLTNGMLQIVDSATNQPRFYRVYAR